MQKRILSIAVAAFAIIILNWSCTKLDTTDIGSGLIPAVDNVHTFDTTLSITTTQGLYADTSVVGRGDDHVIGNITNDPMFGRTTGAIYMQLKPTRYPYFIGGVALDTVIGMDSIILCLKYKGFFGDSTMPIQLEARQIYSDDFRDSFNKVRNVNYTFPSGGSLGPILGSSLVDVRRMGDTIKYRNGRDYSVNTIRIKMDAAWAATLFNRDSISSNGANNAFYNDSIFRRFYNGFAVVATPGSGNALIYTNILDTSTKLEIHYRKRYANVVDTVFTSFRLSDGSASNIQISSTANAIVRNRGGASMQTPSSDEIYLQTSPGTYCKMLIPALSTLNNRIIHRAELIVEQIPNGPMDNIFATPPYLYIDMKDTGTVDKWKPLYVDLNPNVAYDPDFKTGYFFPDDIDYAYFGGYRREKVDGFGNPIKYYNFNLSRYVQRIVTQHIPNYELRLFAAFKFMYPQYVNSFLPSGGQNSVAYGRVKVGSGTNANYKMRLRIIYSKL